MNCYRLLLGMVLVLNAVNGFPSGEEQNAGTIQDARKSGGSGAVIEYKDQATDRSATEKSTTATATSAPEGRSVELIVGGSAEDGVAKRKEMPVGK